MVTKGPFNTLLSGKRPEIELVKKYKEGNQGRWRPVRDGLRREGRNNDTMLNVASITVINSILHNNRQESTFSYSAVVHRR